MRAFFLSLALLLPALTLTPIAAQRLPYRPRIVMEDIPTGPYINTSNGAYCSVYLRGGTYVFTNENGDQATFQFVAPGRLAIIGTYTWDPSVVATVGRDFLGRAQIRFDSPTSAPGFWVLAR